jgi:hypothetical protein
MEFILHPLFFITFNPKLKIMAVDVKFSICQSSDCNSISFTETTGAYHVTTNPTGWGAPNELTSDAISATLTITGPDGTIYSPVNVFTLGTFPKTTSTAYSIAASTIDASLTGFADGDWKMTYTVTTDDNTYEETITFFFFCKIDSCICKKLAALKVNDCDCDPGKIEDVLKAKAYFYALEYAVGCGNITGANDILATLEKMCGC